MELLKTQSSLLKCDLKLRSGHSLLSSLWIRLASTKSYYEILGVRRDSNSSEIKSAYFKLSKSLHPDHNPDSTTHAKFVEVGEAYSVLSKVNSRRQYDYSLKYRNAAAFRQHTASRTTTGQSSSENNDWRHDPHWQSYYRDWTRDNYETTQNNDPPFPFNQSVPRMLTLVLLAAVLYQMVRYYFFIQFRRSEAGFSLSSLLEKDSMAAYENSAKESREQQFRKMLAYAEMRHHFITRLETAKNKLDNEESAQ